jgi:anti-sigma B factor antagonist
MENDRTTVPGYLDFAISVSEAQDGTLVEVRGDLDCHTAPRLYATLSELAAGPRKVILDVGRTDFIDSTGLGVLVAGARRFRQQGGDMVVRSPTPMAARLLEVTGVSKLLTVT